MREGQLRQLKSVDPTNLLGKETPQGFPPTADTRGVLSDTCRKLSGMGDPDFSQHLAALSSFALQEEREWRRGK